MAEGSPGEIIGRNVRAVREAKLFSRPELARRSGVSLAGIDHLERGLSARPRRSTVEKLAKALGIDVEVLMEESEHPLGEAPTSQERLFNNGIFDEERRRARLEEIRESYRESREGLDRYCAHWELRLAEDDLDRRSLEEFFIAAEHWTPILHDAQISELMEIGGAVGFAEAARVSDEMWAQSIIRPAVDRYWQLIRTLSETWKERFAGEQGSEVEIIDLQELRERFEVRRAG